MSGFSHIRQVPFGLVSEHIGDQLSCLGDCGAIVLLQERGQLSERIGNKSPRRYTSGISQTGSLSTVLDPTTNPPYGGEVKYGDRAEQLLERRSQLAELPFAPPSQHDVSPENMGAHCQDRTTPCRYELLALLDRGPRNQIELRAQPQQRFDGTNCSSEQQRRTREYLCGDTSCMPKPNQRRCPVVL